MLSATYLRAPASISVTQCMQQTGLPETDCQNILLEIQGQPNLYYSIARAALLKYGAKACAKYLQAQTGVPQKVGLPACDYAIGKLWEAWGKIMLKGGPDWRSLPAGGGYEMIHWRRCESWTDLQPGEHWDQRGKRCVLNVAILQQKDQPQVVVYVPCQHLPNDGSNYACIDKDGVSRPTGSKTPTYSSGWFGKRFEHSSGGWPYEFEMNPWKISEIETDTGFLQRNRPTAQEYSYARVTDPYPTGTIATKSKDQWIVAVPRTDLAGEGDYHITMSATDPVKRGARIVSPWLFEYKTGARSWYATPPAWAAIGLLGAAVAGGIWYKRTR